MLGRKEGSKEGILRIAGKRVLVTRMTSSLVQHRVTMDSIWSNQVLIKQPVLDSWFSSKLAIFTASHVVPPCVFRFHPLHCSCSKCLFDTPSVTVTLFTVTIRNSDSFWGPKKDLLILKITGYSDSLLQWHFFKSPQHCHCNLSSLYFAHRIAWQRRLLESLYPAVQISL